MIDSLNGAPCASIRVKHIVSRKGATENGSLRLARADARVRAGFPAAAAERISAFGLLAGGAGLRTVSGIYDSQLQGIDKFPYWRNHPIAGDNS